VKTAAGSKWLGRGSVTANLLAEYRPSREGMESLDYKNWMATSTFGLWPTGVVPGKQPNGSYRDIEDLGIAKLYVGIGHEAHTRQFKLKDRYRRYSGRCSFGFG
jgi:hypothetical protein